MRLLSALTPLILAACAGQATGPSLSQRAIEATDLGEPVREVAPPATADAALLAQIEQLLNRAQAGQGAFAALLPRARTAAAAAGTEASESWVVAQQQLSGLESARAETVSALAELDALLATRLLSGTDAGLVELQAAELRITPIAQAQQRELDGLAARLSR